MFYLIFHCSGAMKYRFILVWRSRWRNCSTLYHLVPKSFLSSSLKRLHVKSHFLLVYLTICIRNWWIVYGIMPSRLYRLHRGYIWHCRCIYTKEFRQAVPFKDRKGALIFLTWQHMLKICAYIMPSVLTLTENYP